MTDNQRAALRVLAAMGWGGQWIRGDRLEAPLSRALSTLISLGYVKGKHVRSARRTDYRLTELGAREITKESA